MAHFAEIDADNIVLRVLVVSDEEEHRGHEFLADDLGLGGTWIQTSYNTFNGEHSGGGTPMRSNYANIGTVYLPDADAFQQGEGMRLHPSWVLNSNYVWVAPVAEPDHDPLTERLEWNEGTTLWDVIEQETDPDA
jgi:hypothetical protein